MAGLYSAYRMAAFISRHLPLKFAYWVGLRVADLFYLCKKHDRQAVEENLRVIFAYRGVEPARLAIRGQARKCFQYFGKYVVDFFRFLSMDKDDVRERISIEHPEYIEQCATMRRGAVLVTAHFGSWELAGAALAAMGYRVHAVVLPQRGSQLNRLFQSQRQKRGIDVIPLDCHTVRRTLELLKAGEFVAVLGDRDFRGHGVPVKFFGRTALLPRGPAWLAKATGSPLLIGFLIREVDDSFLMRVYPPILPETAATEYELTCRLASILEREIGERPYQWYMFSPFWQDSADAETS